jgi:diacylglycerol kinase family enzyme
MLLQAGVRSKVAVILNHNASGVRPEVVERLGRLVPARDLFLSRNPDHSREIARTVVERAYDGVLFGGGDGTFVRCFSDIADEARRSDVPLPGVGVLRLGTGNALADALGASRPTLDGLVKDLRRARGGAGSTVLPLLTIGDKVTPFAGCGLDAQILEDYSAVGRLLDELGGGYKQKLGATGCYALTVAMRSTPRFLLSKLPQIEVVNRGNPAYRIDWRTGRVVDERPIAAGEVLFRGRAMLCSASTIPYFGLKLKMFPYVNARTDRFQLRCATASAYETVRNLPAVFRGEYKSPNLHDWLCDAIEVRMEQPVPIQVGGDVQPQRCDNLRIGLFSETVRVLA